MSASIRATSAVKTERQRIPVGATVLYREADLSQGGIPGRVMRHITPSVGAPSMALIAWANGSTSRVNTRNLKRAELTDMVTIERERYEQMQRDLADALSAVHTIFHRCACGRLAERGIICPTVQEGGDCEAGR